MQLIQGFQPCVTENSRVLVLGSFPSVMSRSNGFYYGNNRNRFWPMMQLFFGGSIDTVEDKIKLLHASGVALWDVVQRCTVVSSRDDSIRNIELADVEGLINRYRIPLIVCNGRLSYNLTVKNFSRCAQIEYAPSTSPANVRFDIEVWRKLLTYKE